jgi:hypothetical protein
MTKLLATLIIGAFSVAAFAAPPAATTASAPAATVAAPVNVDAISFFGLVTPKQVF